jgi:hypothetical protein
MSVFSAGVPTLCVFAGLAFLVTFTYFFNIGIFWLNRTLGVFKFYEIPRNKEEDRIDIFLEGFACSIFEFVMILWYSAQVALSMDFHKKATNKEFVFLIIVAVFSYCHFHVFLIKSQYCLAAIAFAIEYALVLSICEFVVVINEWIWPEKCVFCGTPKQKIE